MLRALLMATLGLMMSTPSLTYAKDMRMEEGETSIYAFILTRRDLAGAQSFCQRLEAPGLDIQSDEAVLLDDFRLLKIESTTELDYIHSRVFGHKILDTWTWIGDITYKGAPAPEAGEGLLLKDWRNPKNLGSAPVSYKNAFVCEMPTQGRYALDWGPLEEGEIRGSLLRFEGSTYAFQEEKTTFRQAANLCRDVRIEAGGEVIDDFELLTLNSPTEHRRIHRLVQQNGGAWTWAGAIKYPPSPAPTEGKAYVMTDPEDFATLDEKAFGESHAYVCESKGQSDAFSITSALEVSPSLTAITEADIDDNIALHDGQIYVFLSARRTFEDARSRCQTYAREVSGRTYDDFEMVTLSTVGERQVVHELIRENGGRWTWAGHIDLPGVQSGDGERQPVFTDFEDATQLSYKAIAEKHSYVCETPARP